MAGSEPPRIPDAAEGAWIGPDDVFHGEGAYWDPVDGVLRSVDMHAGDVVSDPGGVERRHRIGDMVAMMRRRRSGGWAVADERGFQLLHADFRVQRRITVLDDPLLRMNEGACDPAGRMFCGSMAYDAAPGAGSLHRLDPDGSVHLALRSVTIPNGLVWVAGGSVALHADTGERVIHRYEYDPARGEFGAREPFVRFGRGGAPDGMALDREEGLWVAMWGGAAVHRYDRDGRLAANVPLPVTNPTSCAFGGPHGRTLFVTTSKVGVDPAVQPLAGRVLRLEVGIEGAPVHDFAG